MLTNKFFERRINKILGIKQTDLDAGMGNKNHIVYTFHNSKPIKVELRDNPIPPSKPKFKSKDYTVSGRYIHDITDNVVYSFYSQDLVNKRDNLNRLRIQNDRIYNHYEAIRNSEDLRRNFTHNDYMKMFDISDIKKKYKDGNDKFKETIKGKKLYNKIIKNKIKSKVVTRSLQDPLPDVTGIDNIKYNTMNSGSRDVTIRTAGGLESRRNYTVFTPNEINRHQLSLFHQTDRPTQNHTNSFRRMTRLEGGRDIILPQSERNSPLKNTEILQLDQAAFTPADSFHHNMDAINNSPIRSSRSNFTMTTFKNMSLEPSFNIRKSVSQMIRQKIPIIEKIEEDEDEPRIKDPIERYLTQTSFFQTNAYKDYRLNCKTEYDKLLKTLNKIEHQYAKKKTLRVDEINDFLQTKTILNIEKFNKKFIPKYFD
jgi:hypothetical protein